jgi:anhydro-N-acetylmuramic acid kinase
MTGNSMDAIDLICTIFKDDGTMQDVCSYTKPYNTEMQARMEMLRTQCYNQTADEIQAFPTFRELHDTYVRQIADCINEMLTVHQLDKSSVEAIGFHGKTLDHNPPSKAKATGTLPYTLQMGSGKMLADLTQIPVVYDFRSDALMAGFEGAPLVAPHNAHIAKTEGDGCYYNGGNTSNFALVVNGKAVLSADAGPFNEYVDNYVRSHTTEAFDCDGMFGKRGHLNQTLLNTLFDVGRTYYETPLPKSGDPAYYHKEQIFHYIDRSSFKTEDVIHTLEYFAAYVAVQALTLVPDDVPLPHRMVLFGGGWNNPITGKSFEDLLNGNGYVLPEHEAQFAHLGNRFEHQPKVIRSAFGHYMEARLFADLACYKLLNKAWPIPEIEKSGQKIVLGRVAQPKFLRRTYDDCLNRAAKGWQSKLLSQHE